MIYKRLKLLREDLGLSQKELGKWLGVSSSTIGMYEANKRIPDANMIEKIADFFQVSVDYLLGRNKNNSITQDKYDNDIIKLEIESENVELTIAEIQDMINKLDEIGFNVKKLINK